MTQTGGYDWWWVYASAWDKLIGYTIALGLTIIITTLWIYLWKWAL